MADAAAVGNILVFSTGAGGALVIVGSLADLEAVERAFGEPAAGTGENIVLSGGPFKDC